MNDLFIDSTNIANTNGKLLFGYNIKIKNKKSIKISIIVDFNKIPYYMEITKGSIHDAKIMESMIIYNFKNNKKEINLIGDKGYIKNPEYIKSIKNNNNIVLITPYKNNSKNILLNTDSEKLKKRYKVENYFSLLKRKYKKITIINDKKLDHYCSFLSIANSLISLKLIIKL
jgi:hypothetical protein